MERLMRDLSSPRAQHLVYLLHVWVCVPFLFFWVGDPRISDTLGAKAAMNLRILVAALLLYVIVRTWLAYHDPPKLKWWLVFPVADIVVITALLCLTHRGPMSNITLLYFLPMIQAASALNFRWSIAVGALVVLGTAISVPYTDTTAILHTPATVHEMLRDDPLNVAFRVLFPLVICSLLAFQGLVTSGYRVRLGVAADRNRIAMEMHDGVQGHLIGVASQLELISRIAEQDGKRAAGAAREGRESATGAADELRYLVQRLRTPSLEAGFAQALRQYAHNVCDRNELRLTFELEGENVPVAMETENALFRIAQEALTNVVKHAKAQSVSISLKVDPSAAHIAISDDGTGFVLDTVTGGIGLEGMRTRAMENGGAVTISSQPGNGTTVEAVFKGGA